jgi:MFS family permease
MEMAGERQRGRVTSMQAMSQAVSNIGATLIGFLISVLVGPAALGAWGWRVALGLGLLILPLALVMRGNMPETHSVDAPVADRPNGAATIAAAATNSPLRAVAMGAVLFGAGTIGNYCSTYTATFAQATLHLSATIGFAASLASASGAFTGACMGGWACDRFGRRPTMLVAYCISLVLPIPLFAWIIAAPGLLSLAISAFLISVFTSLGIAAVFVTIAESLPKTQRAHRMAMVYAVPIAVFGGSTQLFLTWLLHVTGTPMAVAWLRTAAIAISLVAILLLRESAPTRAPLLVAA